MQFVKQSISLPVKNVEYELNQQNEVRNRHSSLLPNNIRCIICGPSNSGKTNVMLSLLESPNGLRYENVYVYSKSLFQPKYVYLQQLLSKIEEIGCYMFSCSDDVIPIEQVKPNSIFIFDDVICEKQSNIRQYFCMGRHKNVDTFYLSQSFTHIPKHLIRENTNFVILFKQDDANLRHVFDDFSISCDMNYNTFKQMCVKCWSENFGFVVIDVENTIKHGKYRKGFDQFILFNKFSLARDVEERG